jgi:hypothetical protein
LEVKALKIFTSEADREVDVYLIGFCREASPLLSGAEHLME